MSRSDVVSALCLPDSARVDQRVPKKLLLENGAPTASDKRLITDAIEDIQWLAALKPNTIGVPEYRDTQREYLEVAVLAVSLRGVIKPASLSRLAELVHRAVPYPVLLLLDARRNEDAAAAAYEKAANCKPLDAMEALDAAWARDQLE